MELKPCPFCGGTDLKTIVQERHENNIRCQNYLCNGMAPVSLWNNRPQEQKLKDAIDDALKTFKHIIDGEWTVRMIKSRLKDSRASMIKLLVGHKK